MEQNILSGAVRETAMAVAVGAGMLLGGAGYAEALPQSHFFNVLGGGTETVSFGFDQFNPGLGTLTGVAISVPAYGMSHFSIASILGGEEGDSIIVNQAGNLVLSGPGGALFSGSASSAANCSADFDGNCSNLDFGTHGTFLDVNFVSLTLQVDLDPFIGAGTVNLTAAINGYVSNILPFLGGMPLGDTSQSMNFIQWTPTVEVEYTFSAITATPEPASLALFGSAIGLAGLLRRRRG